MARIVFATDLHLNDGREGLTSFAADLAAIAALEPRPDLVVCGGDICLWEPSAGAPLQALLRDFPISVVQLMGNHDTSPGAPIDAFDGDFVALFGSRNSHVELGDVDVIALNTCCPAPEYDNLASWHNIKGAVTEVDLRWLDEVLAASANPEVPLLVCVHIPLVTTFPDRRNASAADRAVWQVAEADRVLERLGARTCVVVQGHLHENEHLHRHGVHLVTVGSICGAWWRDGARSRCVDGAPRGWLVVDVADGQIDLSYRAAGGSAQWQGELFERDGETYLNLFFGDPTQPVEVLGDDGWVQIEPMPAFPLDHVQSSTHVWRLPPAMAGARAIQVRSYMRGRPWSVGRVTRSP